MDADPYYSTKPLFWEVINFLRSWIPQIQCLVNQKCLRKSSSRNGLKGSNKQSLLSKFQSHLESHSCFVFLLPHFSTEIWDLNYFLYHSLLNKHLLGGRLSLKHFNILKNLWGTYCSSQFKKIKAQRLNNQPKSPQFEDGTVGILTLNSDSKAPAASLKNKQNLILRGKITNYNVPYLFRKSKSGDYRLTIIVLCSSRCFKNALPFIRI